MYSKFPQKTKETHEKQKTKFFNPSVYIFFYHRIAHDQIYVLYRLCTTVYIYVHADIETHV